MRNLTATLCLTITVPLASVGMSASADFQKGLTAARNGDFATALREWTPLAQQGNASAQSSLGLMYALVDGVAADYIPAYMWLKIAVSSGNMLAIKNIDAIAKRMTPTDISTAQKLARECLRKKYKGCLS